MNEQEYNSSLWFTMGSHCDGKHFIVGNPHTFPGRFLAWCPEKQVSFFASKVEIEEMSTESRYWIQGFLSGNEPEPPCDETGDVDFESKDYALWSEKCEAFAVTGSWQTQEKEIS